MLQPGLVLGEYRLLEPLGRGGFGDVWKARHVPDDALVAVKVAHDAGAVQRLQSGALLQRGLDHPNIVKVLDLWARHDPPFLVMEFVDGRTLADLLREQRERKRFLPVEEALAMFAQILDAVAYAHGRTPPVIHGDLKPHNVLVDRAGGARIIDFDLGRRAAPSSGSIEMSGERHDTGVRGTWAYLAPEQKSGDPADERSEIYSLGIILQEMLTNLADIGRSRPSSVNPAIPPPVEQALLRALEGVREQRYRSVLEFAETLGRPCEPEPFWFASPFDWVEPVERRGPSTIAVFSPDGSELAAGGEHGEVSTGVRDFPGHSGYVTALIYSADGRRLASGSLGGAIHIWDAATGRMIVKIPGLKSAVSALAFSPDGRRIASGTDEGAVQIWDVATGHAAGEAPGHAEGVSALAWWPTGLVHAGWDGKIWEGERCTEMPSTVTAIAEGPVFGCDDGTVHSRGKEIARHDRRVRAVGCGWSADDACVKIWGVREIAVRGFRAFHAPRIACARATGGIRISSGLPDELDWSPGTGGRAEARVRVVSSPGSVEIVVEIAAAEPVHRLVGRVRSEARFLDGAVLPFGTVGRTARTGIRVPVPPGERARKVVASIEFGDTTPAQLFEVDVHPEPPRDVRYALRVRDDTPNARGNRDRKIQPGESLDVELTLRNAGTSLARLRVDAACDTSGARLLAAPARVISVAPGASMPVARTLVVSPGFRGETIAVRWTVGDAEVRFAIPVNRTITVVEGTLQPAARPGV